MYIYIYIYIYIKINMTLSSPYPSSASAANRGGSRIESPVLGPPTSDFAAVPGTLGPLHQEKTTSASEIMQEKDDRQVNKYI